MLDSQISSSCRYNLEYLEYLPSGITYRRICWIVGLLDVLWIQSLANYDRRCNSQGRTRASGYVACDTDTACGLALHSVWPRTIDQSRICGRPYLRYAAPRQMRRRRRPVWMRRLRPLSATVASTTREAVSYWRREAMSHLSGADLWSRNLVWKNPYFR